jgi:small GTP-binding protein
MNNYKVVTLGQTGVGKTTLINAYQLKRFDQHSVATIGAAFCKFHYTSKVINSKCSFDMWDTAGQERYRCLAPMYYRGAHLILYCFALDDKTSLDEVKYWINKVNRREETNKYSIIIGIKKDLWDKTYFSEDDIRDLSDRFDIPYILVSCKDINDVDKCFRLIFEETIKNVQLPVNNIITLPPRPITLKQKIKSKCCE